MRFLTYQQRWDDVEGGGGMIFIVSHDDYVSVDDLTANSDLACMKANCVFFIHNLSDAWFPPSFHYS